jgi:DNA-binding NarL/FixJ family response regulator
MARTVLVIDDSSAFRASARMLLQARGYEVVGVAGDIATGVSTAHELRPDCVVMDINLPDGNGLDAARTLPSDGYAPAIVLVSTLEAAAIGDVEGSGARGFVPKAELASPRLVELLGPP